MPVWPTGGFPIGDVRDTALLHAELLTTPRHGVDRHFGPGRYVTTRQYVQAVREVTGRALPTAFLPARPMLPFAYAMDLVQRVWPWHIPAEYGACYVCACDARPADVPSAFGPRPRPFVETLSDALYWLYRRGLLSTAQAGLAAVRGRDDSVGATQAEAA
jgi:hypothetical protein